MTISKNGRPRIVFDLALVEKFTAESKNDTEICQKLGCHRNTLIRNKDVDSDFREAYNRGLEKRRQLRPKKERTTRDGLIHPPKFQSNLKEFAENYARKYSVSLEIGMIVAKYRLYAKTYNRYSKLTDDWRKVKNYDKLKKYMQEVMRALLVDNTIEEKDLPVSKIVFCAAMVGFRAGAIAEITGESIYLVKEYLNNLMENGYWTTECLFNSDWHDEEKGTLRFILDILCAQGVIVRTSC